MLLQNDDTASLPCFFFCYFPFDATFLYPQRHEAEQETVLPATLFSGTLKKRKLNIVCRASSRYPYTKQ